MFQNSPDEFYILEIGVASPDESIPTNYNINPGNTIMRWEETRLISARVNDTQIIINESSDYFLTSHVVAEINSVDMSQSDLVSVDLDLISLSPELEYIATPMVLPETEDSDLTIPYLFIRDLDENFQLLESFEYPIEWWHIPKRSSPMWISDSTIVFLVHDGTYQTQQIVLYDTIEDDFSIIHEMTCPTCNFISYLTYNEISEEIIFWQPDADFGWELVGVSTETSSRRQFLIANTVPSPIYISPDGNYLASSILSSTNSLIIIDVATGEVITGQEIMHENIKLLGWVSLN